MRGRIGLIVLIGLSSVGCTHIHSGAGSAPVDRRMPPSMIPPSAADRDQRSATKRVSDKEAPSDLVATDASRCSVSEEDFRLAEIGKSFTCDWRKAAGKPGKPL
ncbi:MAG: hypothetical protein JWM41_3040 [Gemmatimonadetes bacterium]|nr:hypothetical protein [Gemmatimonadota bacterium]